MGLPLWLPVSLRLPDPHRCDIKDLQAYQTEMKQPDGQEPRKATLSRMSLSGCVMDGGLFLPALPTGCGDTASLCYGPCAVLPGADGPLSLGVWQQNVRHRRPRRPQSSRCWGLVPLQTPALSRVISRDGVPSVQCSLCPYLTGDGGGGTVKPERSFPIPGLWLRCDTTS